MGFGFGGREEGGSFLDSWSGGNVPACSLSEGEKSEERDDVEKKHFCEKSGLSDGSSVGDSTPSSVEKESDVQRRNEK